MRPAPLLSTDNEFFWRGAAHGRLLCRKCRACGRLQHPPTPLCPACHSSEWDEAELSGRGTVAGFILIHHPPNPWFDMPILVATIDPDEGVQLVSNLCDVERDDVEVGMDIEVFFEPTEGDLGVPLFRPRRDAEA